MNPTHKVSSKDNPGAPMQLRALLRHWRWGIDLAIVSWLISAWVIPEWTPGIETDAGLFGHYVRHWQSMAVDWPIWMVSGFTLAFVLGGVTGLPFPNFVGMACAAVYGFWPAMIAAWPGVVAGSVVGVMLVRRYLCPWVHSRWPAEVEALARSAAKSPAGLVLSLRITPVIPPTLANLLIGVMDIRLWTFTWASMVGRLPLTYLFCKAGESISYSIESGVLVDRVTATLLALAALLPHIVVAVKTALVGKRVSAVQASP